MSAVNVPHTSKHSEVLCRLPIRLIIAASAVFAMAQMVMLGSVGAGPLTRHMIHHIFTMDVAAVALAWALAPKAKALRKPVPLSKATATQLIVLYVWHAPQPFHWAQTSPFGHTTMAATLLLAATLFWVAVMTTGGPERWRSILALLVTGKLFCLLGAILVFAPRPIYSCLDSAVCGTVPAFGQALADQQLAGLLMIAVCPITYVLAGIIIATRWIFHLSERDTASAFERS